MKTFFRLGVVGLGHRGRFMVKCADAGIAHRIVEAKNELEKIREQIQNLE